MSKMRKPRFLGRRVSEFGFPFEPCCLDCLYFRKKIGSNKNCTETYIHYMCQLTYEPLVNVAESIGKFCPLEFISSDEHFEKTGEKVKTEDED